MHARSTFLAISSVRSARNGYAEAIDRFFSDVSTRSNGRHSLGERQPSFNS